MSVPHPDPISGETYSAAELLPDDSRVVLLDQRQLPDAEEYLELRTSSEVARGIADMVVRGAPAIGIAAAYGMVLAARRGTGAAQERLETAGAELVATRPTAVNLAWAVQGALQRAREVGFSSANLADELASFARGLHRSDVRACRDMGRAALDLVPAGATILTHCNAGALATGGYGTALGVIRAAHEAGRGVRVLADETRPYLQGARLTAWELDRSGIPVEVIADSAAAWMMARGDVGLVVVGADRIAANGDIANKIGTYGVACLAHAHGVPFYVVAPWSTVDLACASGASIDIEERGAREVTHLGERRLVPSGVGVRNPAFDVTPARLVSAIVTERGVARPVSGAEVQRLAASRAVDG